MEEDDPFSLISRMGVVPVETKTGEVDWGTLLEVGGEPE